MKQNLRRGASFLLALVMCLTLLPAPARATDSDLWTDHAQTVTPNAEGVYEIATAAQLAWLAKVANDGSVEQHVYEIVDGNRIETRTVFRLTADIDLSAHRWTPIGFGYDSRDFRRFFFGTFDGGGHTVTGLRVGSAEAPYTDNRYAGLFGYVLGEISDLRLADAAVYADTPGASDPYTFAGLIAGELGGGDAAIRYCETSGTVWTGGTTGRAVNAAAGGVVGSLYQGTVEACRAEVTLGVLAAERHAALGGVAGCAGEYMPTLIRNCAASVTLTDANDYHTGGAEFGTLTAHGFEDCAIVNSVGVADCGGVPADQVSCPGTRSSAVCVEKNTGAGDRFRYYDGAGALSDAVTTGDAMRSPDFLAALNDTAGMIEGATAWRTGSDGFPTVAKAGLRAYHTVTFSSAGKTLATCAVPDGEPVAAIAEPSRHGYTFLWWYADDADAPYNFSAPVTSPLTLTAAWDAHGYTVLFDSGGGSYVYPQTVRQDASVREPEPPRRKGFTFLGWFTDEDCTAAWSFGDGAQGDMTLYAGWSKAGGASLSGRITDAVTGEPVNGALVTLSNGQNAPSDELGYYRLGNVAAGDYTITVTANGYVNETTGGFAVGDASTGYDAALTPDEGGANNTVTVYATVSCVYSALMLRDVTVEAAGVDGQGRALGPYTGVTDDRGNVSFVRIPGGQYTFSVNRTGRPGWESYTSAQTETLSGHYNLECALKPNYQTLTVTVTGYDPVRDEDNVPLAGKRVRLTGVDPADRTKKLCLVDTTTDENGAVVFDHAVPITWEIVCEDACYQSASDTVYATADGKLTRNAVALHPAFINSSVTVKLSSPYADPDIFKNTTIGEGRLDPGFSDDGREKLGVQLVGTPGTQTAGVVREVELNDEGRAVFERLPSGNYTLTASGSAKRYVPVFANDGREIYSSSEDTRYGPKYFFADFYGTGSANVALGERSEATLRVEPAPVRFSGTLFKSDMNEDGTITTVPLPNTRLTVKPSAYYRLNNAPAEGYEIETDENGGYAVTLAPGLWGVEVEDAYRDYFGGHLLYHEGATDTCYYDYNIRGWPCTERWRDSRQAAWAWLSSGDQQPYGDIAGMNLSSGTVVADLELMQKTFRYSLGDANNVSFVGIARTTNAEMHLIIDSRKEDDGEWGFQTVDYHTESRGATVAMDGADLSAVLDMTGQRFPASFNALTPGDYTFTYTLDRAFSHLYLTNWTYQTRARLPYDGEKEVSFFDFPAPGKLPDVFPEDYVDIRYPNDEAKNPWPLQTVKDDEVGVEFAHGNGRRSLFDLRDDDPSNGELKFKFKNLNYYVFETLDFTPPENGGPSSGEIRLAQMQDDPDTYHDLYLSSQSGAMRTYGYCPPDDPQTETYNREHWDQEYTSVEHADFWSTLFAYTTDKIPGKLFSLRSTYDEWDRDDTAIPDGNVTLYFCAEAGSWDHELLVSNGDQERNRSLFPGQTGDLWFAVDVPADGEAKEYSIDFARKQGGGNGFRFLTQAEVQNLIHPRNIVVKAVDRDNNAAELNVPVSVATSDNHTFHSGQTYESQTCSDSLSAVTVDSPEWECKGYLHVVGQYDEATKTETFLVPLNRKMYAHTVTVKDDAGNPVVNAAVTLWGERFDPVTIRTDGDGNATAGEMGWYPDGYRMGGGLYYQGHQARVAARGYAEACYSLSAAQLAAGEPVSVTLTRSAQPSFTPDKQTLDKKGAFLPGVRFDGSTSQLEFVTEFAESNSQFYLGVDAELTIPEGDELTEMYLVDRRSFAAENSADSEPSMLVPPDTFAGYNPSQVWAFLDKLKSGAFGKVYVQQFVNKRYDSDNPFQKVTEYEGSGTRYAFHSEVPLWELPVGAFSPCLIAVTAKGAAQIHTFVYDTREQERLVGVKLEGDMADTLNWLASLSNIKALGGETALRGMETLLQHVPVIHTPTGTFVPNVNFTANVASDGDGYLTYTYEVKGELTQGTSITSYAANSYASYLPTATGLIAIGGWTMALDGKARELDSGYMVEVKGGNLQAKNYAPKGLLESKLPVSFDFEVTDPPSGLMTKTAKQKFDADNHIYERHYLVSAAGRVNVWLNLSGFKASQFFAPGVGKVLSLLAEKGALDLGVEARAIAGANFTMDFAPFFTEDYGELFQYDRLGVGVGVRLGFYAKALGEALVANATIGISGDNPTAKLDNMLTLTASVKEVMGLPVLLPTEIQGKVNANAHILVRTWFINGEKDFNYDLYTFKYQFGTETQFSLTQIGVTGELFSRDDFTPSVFNGRPETAVNNLLPIGGCATDERGAFVYTDMESKGGDMRLLFSAYAGDKVWNAPAVVTRTDGLIPSCDVVSLGGGRYLAVWTEIDREHMRETCPPSVVKWSVGTVSDGSWVGSANTLDSLPTEVASRLLLVGDGNGVYLAALRTAEGAVADRWSVSGYRFDGERWSAGTELAKDQPMQDLKAAALDGKLLVCYVTGDGELVSLDWNGTETNAVGFEALPGGVALTADEECAYLACRTAEGLSLYRKSGEWSRLTTVEGTENVGNPALCVDEGRLVLSWTDGTETGDAATLDTGFLHDANLHAAVYDTDGALLIADAKLKSLTGGRFRDSQTLILDDELIVLSVLDDETDRLNVYSGGALPTVVGKPAVTGSVSGGTIAYTVENLPDGAKLIAARYDNGRMTDAKTVDSPEASGTVTLSGSGSSFRLFLTDSSGMRPLCKAWENAQENG